MIADGVIEHECELSEISVRMLRAWARCIAFAADLASHDELLHAVEHFRLIMNASGGVLMGIDAKCLDMLHDELAWRSKPCGAR